ncbi:unnamed protein product [Allacma fusca]|uniref:Uncharacterized protein n=1 Tax=Allacma fusca TaxID=39272 RepID=A0A8J2NXL0_9HEXA|nr:unnamed protein product [Allacma fusca]
MKVSLIKHTLREQVWSKFENKPVLGCCSANVDLTTLMLELQANIIVLSHFRYWFNSGLALSKSSKFSVLAGQSIHLTSGLWLDREESNDPNCCVRNCEEEL